MQRAIVAVAFLASLISLIVIGGSGTALLAIVNSGERGNGALLALGGLVAFAAVSGLVFARKGSFASAPRRTLAIAAAVIGATPVAGLAFVLIRFAGLPFDSVMPIIDWSALAIGIAMAVGALAILALGHRRSIEAGLAEPEEPVVVHMQQIRNAQQQLRSAFEADGLRRTLDDIKEDEIRVRRV
jgi:hypothetical protein